MRARCGQMEGIVIVMDVGPGVRAGVDNTFYKQAKECLQNILQRKVFADKCRDQVGIVLFGTDGTRNQLSNSDEYQHITVYRPISAVDWEMLESLANLPRGKESGDWVDALVVAMDLLHDPDQSRFSSKKIILITDFSGDFSDDQTSNIVSGLKDLNIELSVIGPEIGEDSDEDGASGGMKQSQQNWNGKMKTPVQLAAEALISNIVNEIDGIICSFEDAIPQLLFFQKKSANSANWNVTLDIGKNFQIPITGRIKVNKSTPTTWKKEYAHDETAQITPETSYHRNDDAQTLVNEDEVIGGYKYGTTLVPFSEEDEKMRYTPEGIRGLSVLGFTRSSNVSLQHRAGDQVMVITGREMDKDSDIALSSIIQGLLELDMVIVARKTYNRASKPQLGALYPDITKNYECLIWIPLPFQLSLKYFEFIVQYFYSTLNCKLCCQNKAINENFVDLALLCGEEEDEEEELEPTSVLNPQLQHFFNVLTHRALNKNKPLPAPAQHITAILQPPEMVVEGRDNVAATLASLFPIKKIEKKSKRNNENVFAAFDEPDQKKARTDGDTSVSVNDLTYGVVTHITSASPVTDFMALLRGEEPNFTLICGQMDSVIRQLVEGLGGTGVADAVIIGKVINCLKAYRQEATVIDPTTFNTFMHTLKDVVSVRSLMDLWTQIKEESLIL
ncbi:unnamed protein product, partial [Meganyctiphanes norvegica]